MGKRAMYCMLYLFFLLLAISISAWGGTKLDPLFGVYRAAQGVGISAGAPIKFSRSGITLIQALVKAGNVDEVASFISPHGGVVQTTVGNILVVEVPLDLVDDLSAMDAVEYVEAPKLLTKKMDIAVQQTNVDDVHSGKGVDTAYDGEGVIIGVVDDGFDYTHHMFQGADGKTRILYLWDQSASGDGVNEIEDSSGVECTADDIDGGTCTATGDSDGHGTHVAAIAAGRDSTYMGVAPSADLILVKYSLSDADASGAFSTAVLNAVKYIFDKAEALGRPVVINLSLGTSLGAHDGTSLLEQGLDKLLSGKQGRAIVNAAGNERFLSSDSWSGTYGGIHAGMVVGSGETKVHEFVFYGNEPEVYVDIWMNKGASCELAVDVFKRSDSSTVLDWSAQTSSVGPAKYGSVTHQEGGADKFKVVIDFKDSENSQNNKRHAFIHVERLSSSVDMRDYVFHVVYYNPGSGNCEVESWLYPDLTVWADFTSKNLVSPLDGGAVYVAGDSNKTVTIPSTASKVICVASYMSRRYWTDVNGVEHDATDYLNEPTAAGAMGGTLYDISLFSSLGPSADVERTGAKPDIAAPGEAIISARSSFHSPNPVVAVGDYYLKYQGTSMASPHVAGVIALMFQKNPSITAREVKSAIINSAVSDDYTGSELPDPAWGYGKLDAVGAVGGIVSSGGCSLVDRSGCGGGGNCALFGVMPLAEGGGVIYGLHISVVVFMMLLAALLLKRFLFEQGDKRS